MKAEIHFVLSNLESSYVCCLEWMSVEVVIKTYCSRLALWLRLKYLSPQDFVMISCFSFEIAIRIRLTLFELRMVSLESS